MRKNTLVALLLAFSVTLTSCDAIAGIFKAGMWVGIIIVIVVVVLVLWLLGKMRR